MTQYMQEAGAMKQADEALSMSMFASSADYWKAMYDRREEEANQLSEEIIRLLRVAAQAKPVVPTWDQVHDLAVPYSTRDGYGRSFRFGHLYEFAKALLAAANEGTPELKLLAHDLDGVLADVKQGGLQAFDAVCQQTIERVSQRLHELGTLTAGKQGGDGVGADAPLAERCSHGIRWERHCKQCDTQINIDWRCDTSGRGYVLLLNDKPLTGGAAAALARGVKPCCRFPVGGPCPDCPAADGVASDALTSLPLALSVAYFDEVMPDEPPEMRKHWSRVRAALGVKGMGHDTKTAHPPMNSEPTK